MTWCKTGLLSILLLLTACGHLGAPVITATPSPVVVLTTEVPSATPVRRATLPPSWTPVQSWTPTRTLTPSITPTASITLTPSNTFTPSQTFTASKTFTPTATPTANATNQFLLSQPLPAVCATFGADPDKNPRQFAYSTAPTVFWTPVETAVAYQVRLYDSNRVTLLTETTTETALTFASDLFAPGQNYAWDVAPLDNDGVQLCPARGALLVPSP